MPIWLSEDELTTLRAMVDRLIPAGDGSGDGAGGDGSGDGVGGAGSGDGSGDGPDDAPGALRAGAAEYIDGLLGAFLVDPPRIWAGGPYSGRFGGANGYAQFHRLSALDELSWRTRIEGSQGISEREFNGPVVGLQQIYREGLARLGADFTTCGPEEQDARLRADRKFTHIVFVHVCEGTYGAPEYGGNKDLSGWAAIDFAGDVQPRGWSDAEVAGA